MGKKLINKKNATTIGVFVALAAVFLGIIMFNQNFSITGADTSGVYEPVYTQIKCAPIGTETDATTEKDYTDFASNNFDYAYVPCGFQAGNFAHTYYVKDCKVSIQTRSVGSVEGSEKPLRSLKLFKGQRNNFDATKQEVKISSINTGGVYKEVVTLQKDEMLQIIPRDYSLEFGVVAGGAVKDRDELRVKVSAVPYGLATVSGNNLLEQFPTCYLDKVRKGGNTFTTSEIKEAEDKGWVYKDEAGSQVLGFNQYINYVDRLGLFYQSKNIIENEKYWTVGNAVKCEIIKTEEGIKLVDKSKCVNDPSIICNPALPNCGNEGKQIIKVGTNECDATTGVGTFEGYIPNPKASGEVCKASKCVSGKVVPSDCKAIPQCKEGEILTGDYQCYKFETLPKPNPNGEGFNWLPVAIIAIGLIIALAIIIIGKSINKK